MRGVVAALLMLVQPAWLLLPGLAPLRPGRPRALAHTLSRPLVTRTSALRLQQESAETDAEQAADAQEPVAEEAADVDVAPQEPPPKTEKQLLQEQIAALEGNLTVARGALATAQDAAKDAGENGYLLLAANFERYRLTAKEQLGRQGGYGKIATVRALLPFVETFTSLQAQREGASEDAAAIHSYYGGIYKQLMTQLESWAVESYVAEVGSRYDAVLHQKVRSVHSERPEGEVIEVGAQGWKMGEGVVRLAEVVVSLGEAKESDGEVTRDNSDAAGATQDDAGEEGAEEGGGEE